MLSALNFVRGAVATKDLVPILTAFHIYDGRIQGTNGRLTIDVPCKELGGFDFTVAAPGFLKAVDACDGEPKINASAEGFLAISRGLFKGRLPLLTHDDFPRQDPEGEQGTGLTGYLLPTLKALHPFTSEDASRPWACGILFRESWAFATNNIIVAAAPAVTFKQSLNLPSFLVEELLRIGMEPVEVDANNDRITFKFANGAWMKSCLLSTEWPPVEKMIPESASRAVEPGLLQAVEKILPFCPDPKQPLVFLGGEGIKTSDGDKSAVVGGFTLPDAVYRAEPLMAVLKAATAIDFDFFPKPAPWVGKDGLKGLLVGVAI